MTLLKLVDAGWGISADRVLGPWNLALDPQQWHVVTGPSGHGKSSLVYRILNSDADMQRARGTVEWCGQPLAGGSAKHGDWLRRQVGYVCQEAMACLPSGLRLKEIVTLLAPTAAISFLRLACDELSLPPWELLGERYPFELSGGQRQRFCLSLALAKQPALLLLDEPSSALDAELSRRLPELVRRLAPQAAAIWVTHDRVLLEALGQDGTAATASAEIVHTHAETEVLCELRELAPVAAGRVLCQPISMQIHRSQVTVLMGRSGVGKSSLALLIAGLTDAHVGEIVWHGKRPRVGDRRVQLLFQDSYSCFTPHLKLGLQLEEAAADISYAQICATLEKLAIEPQLIEKLPHQVSGGELQRIALARALLAEPELLICDEPTSALDDKNAALISALLLDTAKRKQLAILVITHDLEWIKYHCQQILELRHS